MPKSNEDIIKGKIRDILINEKGWKWGKNFYGEQYSPSNKYRTDLACYDKYSKPLVAIEVKDKGKDLKKAGEQVIEWALECQTPIAYATDGNIIKTWHLNDKTKEQVIKELQKNKIINESFRGKFIWNHFNEEEKQKIKKFILENGKPLKLNGQEINEFLDEKTAYEYLESDEYNNVDQKIITSRQELIRLFSSINDDLRKGALQAGIERFGELCNILFLKLFSEQEEIKERQGKYTQIKKTCRWNYFKDKNAEELLDHINNTVLDEFRNVYGEDIFPPLQIENPTILKKIIERLDTLYLSAVSSDALGDTFEYFLKAYLVKEKKDLGEYFTPRHLVKFLVELANPHLGDKVYDPFCGTGGILIESYKHIKKWMALNEDSNRILEKETLYGHEIVKNLCRIAKMNMILAGDGHNNVKKLDSWANPINGEYDVVITNMPFGLGSLAEGSQSNYCQKHYLLREEHKKGSCCDKNQGIKTLSKCLQYVELKKEIKNCLKCQELTQSKKNAQKEIDNRYKKYYLDSLNADSLCFEHCFKAINSINTNSRIVIIAPKGILFAPNFTNLRKFIYDNSYVEHIVALPPFAFKPYAEPRAVILYLTNIRNKKEKREQKEVWYFEVKNDGHTANTRRERKEGTNDLEKFQLFKESNEEERLLHGFEKLEMEKIKKNNYISIPNVYQEFTFDSQYGLVTLGELAEEVVEKNNLNAPVWSITNDRGFIPSEENFSERVASEDTSNYKLVLPNQFAYSTARVNVGSINYNRSEKTGCVSPAIGIVFRVKDETKIVPQFLFLLFQSEQFKKQVNNYAFGTVRQTLSWDNFCRIKVPVPPLTEQRKVIEELNKIKENIKNSQQIIDNLNSRLSLSLSLLWERNKN